MSHVTTTTTGQRLLTTCRPSSRYVHVKRTTMTTWLCCCRSSYVGTLQVLYVCMYLDRCTLGHGQLHACLHERICSIERTCAIVHLYQMQIYGCVHKLS